MVHSQPPPDLHEACAVPFRIRDQRIEFCLVSPERTSRWEFPHTLIAAGETPLEAVLRCAQGSTGFACHSARKDPLDDVVTRQNRRLVQLTAYLLEVQSTPEDASRHRIRWCFAEEARARIRRKPMRRLIDLAVRHQTGQSP
jgi:ADP-ribose pyrophosphatase YjhB (NUDIX family)